MSIKIAIVEDHDLFREGIFYLLKTEEDFEITAQFASGDEYIALCKDIEADIVLMDIEMPGLNGIDTTILSQKLIPERKIIALSLYNDIHYYEEMQKAGASGFILKNGKKGELETAIRSIYNGGTFFSQELLENVISKLSHQQNDNTPNLTLKEEELISLICKGYSNKQISDHMCVSPKTIEHNKTKLFDKFSVKNSVELVIYVAKHKIIEL